MAEVETSRWTRYILLITLAVPLGLFFVLYLGAEQKFEEVPYAFSEGDTVSHVLPAFQLVRGNGDTVTHEDFLGHITLLTFFSTDDDAELKTTVLLGNLQRSYDNVEWDMVPPFQFVSINTGDSLAAVQAFAAEMDIDPAHWWVLHGDQAAVLDIAQVAFGMPEFANKQPGFKPFTAQTAALIDKEGRVRKYYVATDLQEERNIQEDLIALLRLQYPEDIERMKQ
jgi:cytochrome oxidase Cu insertion factor (SCO1/SenC/PrrC family)